MAKQAVKQHMKKKAVKTGPKCPRDNSEMQLVMKLKGGSSRGPMYWSCKQCDHDQLKIKGDIQ